MKPSFEGVWYFAGSRTFFISVKSILNRTMVMMHYIII